MNDAELRSWFEDLRAHEASRAPGIEQVLGRPRRRRGRLLRVLLLTSAAAAILVAATVLSRSPARPLAPAPGDSALLHLCEQASVRLTNWRSSTDALLGD
jgi:hypothetical protein